MNKTFRFFFIAAVLSIVVVPSMASAQGVKRSPMILGVQRAVAQADNIAEEAEEGPVDCSYEVPEKANYSASYIATRRQGVVDKGEVFESKIYLRNTGNVPWFSVSSGCPGPTVSLGTDKDRDRSSPFYIDNLLWDSGWAASNRIMLTTRRVEPGEMAEFRFWSEAPKEDGFFREIYTPVAEGVEWIDEGTVITDIKVGEGIIPVDNKHLLEYIQTSANLSDFNVEGEKWIQVDISDQRMRLFVGDYVIRDFPVSTGTYRTPTPIGTTHIFQKQQVRVASSYPHYIMPKWMHFRAGGYGIHALPSLANDGGVFWSEALNHIGTRRSHGCIRLLPNDAEFAYDFASIGTMVSVVP